MSQMFRTPKKIRRRNCATISEIYKSSTPYRNVSLKHYSISLSEIDTGSSSSATEVRKRPRLQISGKRKRITGKKKRVVTQLTDSDSEWETKSEDSVKKTSVDSKGSSSKNAHEECQDDAPVYCNLFEDPKSPEKVRDAPVAYETLLESPILQSSRRLRLVSAKDNLVQRKELLPVPNLRFSKSQDVNPEEIDDDAPIFHHERDSLKTYPAPSKCKKSPERKHDFTFHVRFPTATSDLLWDEFVDKFHDEISQYLASPSTRAPAKLTDSARGLPDVGYSRRRIDPLPAGMKYFSQRCDRDTNRWITCSDFERVGAEQENAKRQNKPETDERGTKARGKNAQKRETKETTLKSVKIPRVDVYDQSDETDIEFETGGRDKRRISLREFCRKQRIKKTKTFPMSPHQDTQ